MALNLSELMQTATRTLHNSVEAIRKWVDMTLAPPKDITIELYDQNGNLVTETLPNYRKQLQTLLGDKKNLPFLDGGYAINAQELANFLANIPIAGHGIIRINTPIVVDRDLVLGSARSCYLVIEDGGQLIFHAYEDTTTNTKKLRRFRVDGDSYFMVSIHQTTIAEPVFGVDLSPVANSTAPWDSWKANRSMFVIIHSELRIETGGASDIVDNRTIVDLSADASLLFSYIARGRSYIGFSYNNGNVGVFKLADTTTPQKILNIDHRANVTLSGRISDSLGNVTNPLGTYTPYVSGIVYYDTSTVTLVPRNVLSAQTLR